jgi:hypothetical protein
MGEQRTGLLAILPHAMVTRDVRRFCKKATSCDLSPHEDKSPAAKGVRDCA